MANAGYRVRTTLRSLNREAEVSAMLLEGGGEAGERLTFIGADLSDNAHLQEIPCVYLKSIRQDE